MGNCRTPVVVLVGCALLSFVVGCSGSDDSGEGATATTTPPSGPTTTAGWSSLVDQLVVNQEQFSEPPAGEPAVNTRRAFGEMDDTSVEAYINAAITHADQQWTGWFTSNGLPEPEVGYKIIMPGEQHQSSCTMNGTNVFASDLPNAFYCRWDRNDFDPDLGMLVFPVQTMANMWTGNIFSQQVSDPSKVGDFAAGAIVAHEFGHHIQDELTENIGAPAPQNPNVELIADCFAGVWAYSVYATGFLEAGDIDEALSALGVIGDNLGSHGTNEERQNAFLIGYQGTTDYAVAGVPANCIAAYWTA